jgi:DNA (cytosine-5)-methyltransferase 1
VVASVFSGIGGFERGLEAAGFATAWQIESDRTCRKVLGRHWPAVERHGDVRGVDGRGLAPVDVVCAGWPKRGGGDHNKGAGVNDGKKGSPRCPQWWQERGEV